MARKKRKNETLYGVIGLGRFGMALAQSLAVAGREILVVDREQSKINQMAAFTDNAYRMEEITKENLEAIGLQECDVVVIGIGEKMDVSILTTLTVLRMGVKRVIAKARSEEHGEVLKTLGAEVVYPEKDMAMRLANKLIAPHVLEYISLSDDIDIMEIVLTERVHGKTVVELNLRGQFGLNIIAVEQNDRLTADVRPDMVLQAGDTIAVVGRPVQIRAFENYLQG
ncbi:MAG: TrkA family potassium uptake protein [Clostridia bacterium]|nr:TrkA family potassium uptake protein [Clostridia bacterium]